MSNIAAFFRANTGALVVTMLLTIGTIVFSFVALLMSRSGTSLRPIIFVAGFFLIILAPQAVWHYSQAFGWIERDDLTWVPGGSGATVRWRANEDLLAVKDGRFTRPADIYGPAYDKDLVSDLRERLAQVFGRAQAAEMAALRSGGMTVLAQFSSPDDAMAAATGYANAMAGHFPEPDANGIHMVQRATDVMAIIVADRTLAAYSAPDSTSVRKLWAESPVVRMVSLEKDAASTDAGAKISRTKFGLIALVLTLFLSVGWFFKMSAWASQSEPAAGVSPVSSATLRERLMAVNALDVPFSVQPSPDDSSVLIGTWRYADAKWIDLARAHGMKRTYRILMKLDEANNTVRPTEQTGALDWSAGAKGGSMQWATQRGIIFFQYETVRVFGLQFDSQNKLTPNLSYKYTFNLQEMKAPLIEAVTKSGWKWRPTMLHGPRWIAWLTE